MTAEIYTRGGWVEFSEDFADAIEDGRHGCMDCGEIATQAVCIGQKDGQELYWCLCDGCADEVECESRAGQYRSEQEMDYYAGYE